MTKCTAEEIEEIKRDTDPECPLFLYGGGPQSSGDHYLAQATRPPTEYGIYATFEGADGVFGRGGVAEGLFSRDTIDEIGFVPLTPAAEDVLSLFEEKEVARG